MSQVRRSISAEVRQIGDGAGVVGGYASIFNSFNNDRAECFAPGCFVDAIRTQHTEPIAQGEPSRFAVCWQHSWGEPIARAVNVSEDEKGLRFVDQLKLIGVDASGVPEVNAEKWEQIKAKLVNGVSIEFDPTRSEFELMSEADARALGYEGDFSPYWPPRRWTKVFLYGWSYVIHPAQNEARILETRAANGGQEMDEEMIKKIVSETIKAEIAKMEERLVKLESGTVEVEIEPSEEPPPIEAMSARLAQLEKRAIDAEFAAFVASNPVASKMSEKAARALYAMPSDARAETMKAMGGTTPALPPIGGGSGMREAGAKPKTAKEAWEAIKTKHGTNRDAANAEWAQVREQYRD